MSRISFCRDHRKPAYSSWVLADRVRHRANRSNRAGLDEGSVYWCPETGRWHVTSWTRGDVDRITAARLSPDSGDRAGDNPRGGWGQRIDLTETGDNVGESSRNSADSGLEILLDGSDESDRKAGKIKAAHP